ncbi:MAG: TPM domain-containing protein [Clostridia bacterium]|nr:TPM domain-containing protein [Clostridia bacterium]
MKKIFALFSVVILILSLSFSSFAIDIPKPTNDFFVNDFANVISEEDEAQIMKIGADLYEQTQAQIVVVTVESLDGYNVDEYALELGREWGVGSKETNNGVVLLLSVSDREVTIQVGYGLEGCVTDAKSGEILDAYAIPYLKNNNFSTGLTEAYKAITMVVCNEYGAELNPDYQIDNYDTYETYTDDYVEDVIGGLIIVIVSIFMLVIMRIIIKKIGDDSNHGDGSNYGGGGYSGNTRYGGYSGPTGGGFSVGGSRGGFSGGGFRGGGGSFGGGGASRGF